MPISTIGLLDDESIPLDLAALVLSALDHPGTDLESYANLLKDIACRLAVKGRNARSPAQRASALAAVIHGEFGFKGDVESYDASSNCDLIHMLDRRQGLPVSLAILYVSAARRIGWMADPLDTPGHVLVHLPGAGLVVIDPFNGGAVVEPEPLLAVLGWAAAAGIALSVPQAGPMSNRNTLVRLLTNQAMRAEGANDPVRAMTVYQRMTQIAPDNPDGWWALARLQLASRLIDQGRASLSAMLEVTRDAARREVIISLLDEISGA